MSPIWCSSLAHINVLSTELLCYNTSEKCFKDVERPFELYQCPESSRETQGLHQLDLLFYFFFFYIEKRVLLIFVCSLRTHWLYSTPKKTHPYGEMTVLVEVILVTSRRVLQYSVSSYLLPPPPPHTPSRCFN